jgi:hypothetical protein
MKKVMKKLSVLLMVLWPLCHFSNNISVTDIYLAGINTNNKTALSSIEGNSAPSISTGGNGRGDILTNLSLVVISGDAIPNMYKGSIGRGDFGSNILNDIFIACNEMIIWTGAASTS